MLTENCKCYLPEELLIIIIRKFITRTCSQALSAMKIIEVQLDVEHARRAAEISRYKILVVYRSRKTSSIVSVSMSQNAQEKKLEAIAAI